MPEWKPVLKVQLCCDAGGQSNSKAARLNGEEARQDGGELPDPKQKYDEADV